MLEDIQYLYKVRDILFPNVLHLVINSFRESRFITREYVLKYGNIKVADVNKEKQKIKMTYING